MKLILKKKPKQGCTVIEGFPGIGLVGTIATEFLIRHLKAERIGYMRGQGVPPMVALHDNKVVSPMGVYYAPKQNIVILHFISGSIGNEWHISDIIIDFSKKYKADKVVSLESIAVPGGFLSNEKTYYFSNDKDSSNKLKKLGIEELKEGIVMGVTSVLMSSNEVPLTCLFGETHTKLPDSKAAASIIDVLNDYMDLKIDTKPLRKSAEEFEKKIKQMIASTAKMQKKGADERLSYLG